MSNSFLSFISWRLSLWWARLTAPAQILDLDSPLHFALLRLQLIELIRTCTTTSPNADITPALKFATSQLAPRASTSKDFLEDLERTMALLVFPTDNLTPQMSELLKPSLRWEVADRVNQAILRRQGQSVEAKIKEWVRARAWAEKEAKLAHKDIPANLKLVLDGDDEEGSEMDDGMNGNGDVDAMITWLPDWEQGVWESGRLDIASWT